MNNRYFAKHLRQQDVPAEDILWQRLRNRRCGNYKFVRQHPIAGYVVDFACRRLRVAIEIDGPSHQHRVGYDAQRSKEIKQCGYEIIRFLNDDIYENIDATVEAIFEYLKMTTSQRSLHPHPTALRPPSPSRERDKGDNP